MIPFTPSVEELDALIGDAENLRTALARELAALLTPGHRLDAAEHARIDDLKDAVHRLDVGVDPGDGVVGEVAAFVQRPEVQRLMLKRPGLAALRRMRDALAAQSVPAPTAGTYRLLAGRRHSLPERDLQPGETIVLTTEQAAAFGDKFERV